MISNSPMIDSNVGDDDIDKKKENCSNDAGNNRVDTLRIIILSAFGDTETSCVFRISVYVQTIYVNNFVYHKLMTSDYGAMLNE